MRAFFHFKYSSNVNCLEREKEREGKNGKEVEIERKKKENRKV